MLQCTSSPLALGCSLGGLESRGIGKGGLAQRCCPPCSHLGCIKSRAVTLCLRLPDPSVTSELQLLLEKGQEKKGRKERCLFRTAHGALSLHPLKTPWVLQTSGALSGPSHLPGPPSFPPLLLQSGLLPRANPARARVLLRDFRWI